MTEDRLKVLAVNDPAVRAYTDKRLNIIKGFGTEVLFDVIPWEHYYETMLQVFAGKAQYDIVMVAGHLWLCDFAEKGCLAPIELEEEDILPVILQEMKYKGNAYLSPSFCDGHMIVYRKSILRESLVEEPDPVVSPLWYTKAAKKLAEASTGAGMKGMTAVAMKAHPSEIFTDALPFLRMNGGDVYHRESKEFLGGREITEGLKAYCGLKKYAPVHTGQYGNEEIAGAIRRKEAAMAVTWSGQMGVVHEEGCAEKEDLGFATFDTAWNVTWSFAVSAGSRNKERANEFLRYLRSPGIDRAAGAMSGAPVREGSYKLGMEQYPWYGCQLEMIKRARALPPMERAGEKNAVLYEEITKAFRGEKTAEQAVKDAGLRIF